MKVSVCIPSYKPEATLSDTIDSLFSQKEKIDQLVIVIDNDRYSAQKELLEKKYSGVFNLMVHMQANQGRAGARNQAAKLATGNILLFLDDDMLASNDLLEKHLAYHEKEKDCVVIGNGYRDKTKAKNDFSKYLVYVDDIWKQGIPEKCDISYKTFVFTACNMSISKDLYERFNGIDTRLSDSEDFDLGLRMLDAGIKIKYDRTVLAWPSDWPDIRAFIKRHNEYASAKKVLVKLHPAYVQYFPRLIPYQRPPVKKMILSIMRGTICKAVINDFFLFRILPLGIKFRLYTLTVSAFADINQ